MVLTRLLDWLRWALRHAGSGDREADETMVERLPELTAEVLRRFGATSARNDALQP